VSDEDNSYPFDDEPDLSDEQIEQILLRAKRRRETGPVPVFIATPLSYKDRIYTDSRPDERKKK